MNKKRIVCTFIIGIVFVANILIFNVDAADDDLAEQYAPILYFVEGEKCYPVNITYALENSYLYQVGNPTPLLTTLTADLISNYTSDDYYL